MGFLIVYVICAVIVFTVFTVALNNEIDRKNRSIKRDAYKFPFWSVITASVLWPFFTIYFVVSFIAYIARYFIQRRKENTNEWKND